MPPWHPVTNLSDLSQIYNFMIIAYLFLHPGPSLESPWTICPMGFHLQWAFLTSLWKLRRLFSKVFLSFIGLISYIYAFCLSAHIPFSPAASCIRPCSTVFFNISHFTNTPFYSFEFPLEAILVVYIIIFFKTLVLCSFP